VSFLENDGLPAHQEIPGMCWDSFPRCQAIIIRPSSEIGELSPRSYNYMYTEVETMGGGERVREHFLSSSLDCYTPFY
jgi:hypothetical protein